jgi:hypothetical protein
MIRMSNRTALIAIRGRNTAMKPRRPAKLTKQTYAIAAVCMIDLVTTVWLLTQHGAREANPIMSYFLTHGVVGFAAAKIAMTAIPLAFMEWARHRSPMMVQRALSLTVVAYVSMYALGVVHANVAYANGGGKDDRAEYSEFRSSGTPDPNWRPKQVRMLAPQSIAAPTPTPEQGKLKRSANEVPSMKAAKLIPIPIPENPVVAGKAGITECR